jgi:hypothetical protein
MTQRAPIVLLAFVLASCGGVAGTAAASGTAAAKGVDLTAGPDGVTVAGSAYRYVAMSPGTAGGGTVVAQLERRGARLNRWWYLPGGFDLPVAAIDDSAGGLAGDDKTLVLSRHSRGYPPRLSRFAILDTVQPPYVRRPAATFVDLRGHYSFDAISPDGSTLYLVHHHLPPHAAEAYLTNYEVRALDLRSGRLLPDPIVDPSEPDEQMQGLPLSRVTSPDGRWAYTLYDGQGDEPFIHALDTVGRRAVCIDLPQLAKLDQRFFYLLQLKVRERGRELVLIRRRPGPPPSRPLLTVDTKSFAVGPPPVAAAEAAGWPSWLALGLAGVALASGIAWRVGRRKTPGGREAGA